MAHRVKLLLANFETHDVRRFVFTRPDGFDYEPGQAVELSLDREKWRDEDRPFTMTSLPRDRVLEFTIKAYPEHDGVTERLHRLSPGDEVMVSDPFDTLSYGGAGVFLAGGAGITPFLAILRHLGQLDKLDDQQLIFSNRTPRDVICERELRELMGDRLVLTCTRESGPGYDDRRIDRAYLEEKVPSFDDRRFYVCGTPEFNKDVKAALEELGAGSSDIEI